MSLASLSLALGASHSQPRASSDARRPRPLGCRNRVCRFLSNLLCARRIRRQGSLRWISGSYVEPSLVPAAPVRCSRRNAVLKSEVGILRATMERVKNERMREALARIFYHDRRATSGVTMSAFSQFLENTRDVPGFFTREAMIAWDFLLGTQNRFPIRGHFLEIGSSKEIGVARAIYLAPDEEAILIDINPCESGVRRVRDVKPNNVTFVQQPSYVGTRSSTVQRLAGQYRFIHIDGDHSGYSVTGDLQFAADALKEDGIICMDDYFNLIYPQVTAAICRFLFDHPMTLRMVLCGANKCFLVKASAYRIYENLIRKFFLDHAAPYDAKFSLHKSGYAHDFGCFSMWTDYDRLPFGIEFRPDERRMIGIDADNTDIVF